MKDKSLIDKTPTLNHSSQANNYSNMGKTNTDLLYARQLSEEMESTIVGIMPGGKISNYDKASRNSSEPDKYRRNSVENFRLFDFTANHFDFGINIDPIGEHLPDEEQDNSSKFGNRLVSFTNGGFQEQALKKPKELGVYYSMNAIPISAMFGGSNNEVFSVDEDDRRISKIPTSSFNKGEEEEESDSHEIESFD